METTIIGKDREQVYQGERPKYNVSPDENTSTGRNKGNVQQRIIVGKNNRSFGNPMRINWDEVSIFVRSGYTDMRKQINSLSILVQRELKLNPLSGNLFVFCGRTRRLLKVLYWQRNGFCMWMKRLEEDRFPWPLTGGEVKQITRREMKMLLSGIDFFHAHSEKKYDFVT